MNQKSEFRHKNGLWIYVMVLLLICSPTFAAFTWDGSEDNDWTTDDNWALGTAPAGAVGDSIIFGAEVAGDHTITNADDTFTAISSLSFAGATGGYTIGGTGSFSIDSGGTVGGDSGFDHAMNVDFISNAADGIVFDNTDNLTIGGVISGAGGITQSGASVLTLLGENTFSGGSTLSAGTLVLGNDDALGTGNLAVTGDSEIQSDDDSRSVGNDIAINDDVTLTVSGSDDLELDGVISGAGELSKSGTSTLTLTGNNGYSGGTDLSDGTLVLGHNNALGVGNLFVSGDSAIQSDNDSRVVGNAVTIGNGVTMTVSGSDNLSLGGTIAGAGELSKSDSGTLTLNGNNTYSGGTTLSAGTMVLGNDHALGSSSLSVTGDSAIQSDDNNRFVDNNIAVSNGVALSVTGNNNLSLDGVISGLGGLNKSGASTLALTGNNTYAGGTDISDGALILGHDNALGTGTLAVTGDSDIQSNNDSRIVDNDIAISSGVTMNLTGEDLLLGGEISGDGGITKSVDNTLTLTGDNIFTGGLDLSAGTLVLGHDNALGTGALSVTGDSDIESDDDSRSVGNDIAISNGVTMNLTGEDLLLGGVISGAGGINKAVDNILTLTGDNTFTGGLDLSAGTLVLGHDDALGTGNLAVTGDSEIQSDDDSRSVGNDVAISNGVTMYLDGEDLLLGGVISGDGGITKSVDNTLTLTGDNIFTGGLDLSAGTLVLGNDSALGTGGLAVTGDSEIQSDDDSRAVSNDIAISEDVTMTVSGSDDLELDGVISGAGALAKSGTSTLTLTGDNTYTGDTDLSAGTLILGHDNALSTGSLAVTDDSTIQSDDDSRVISNAIAISNSVTMTVSGAYDMELAGVMSGLGGLTKSGGSTLLVSGDNTYTGLTTTLSAGTLHLTGQLSSDVDVEGGTFMGTGTIADGGNLTINDGGTFAPGNSIGTMTVTGDYWQNSGAILEIELKKENDGSLSSDLIDVTGYATLEPESTINVTNLTGPDRLIATGDTFTIITTGEGVSDYGPTIDPTIPVSPSNILGFTGEVVGDDYVLTATRIALADYVTGGNNQALMGAIDSDTGDAFGDYVRIINELTDLTSTSDHAALDAAAEQLSPMPYYSITSFTSTMNQRLAADMSGYLSARRQGAAQYARLGSLTAERGLLLAEAANNPQILGQAVRKNERVSSVDEVPKFFVRPFGIYYDHEDTSKFTGFFVRGVGTHLGFDQAYGSNWILGIDGTYNHACIRFDENHGDGDIDSFRAGPYATYFNDLFFVDAALNAGYHLNENRRNIQFGGIDRTAQGDYNAYDLSGYVATGLDLDLDVCKLSPMVSAQYIYYRNEAFTESGAGAAGLDVDAETQQSLLTRAGVRLHTIAEWNEVKFAPEVFAGYAHEFVDEENLEARFVSGASKFAVDVDSNRDDSIFFGAGLSTLLSENVSAFARYEGELYSGSRTHALNFGFTVSF